MATDLVNIDKASEDEILALTGQGGVRRTSSFLTLNINKHAEDDDGNPTPVGTYSSYSPEHQAPVFFPTAEFRPLMRAFQYRVWNADKQEYSNRSIMFKSWSDEAFDEQGGLACGKVAKRKLDQLTDAEKEVQKKIKARIILFGLLNATGQTAKGVAVEFANTPVMWSASGSSFMLLSEPIDRLDRVPMFTKSFSLAKPTRKKEGQTVWYVPTFDWSAAAFKLDEAAIDGIKKAQAYIDETNAEIISKWTAVKSKQSKTSALNAEAIDITKELGFADPINAPLNDKIPF